MDIQLPRCRGFLFTLLKVARDHRFYNFKIGSLRPSKGAILQMSLYWKLSARCRILGSPLICYQLLLNYILIYANRHPKMIFLVSRNFFSWILISKIGVKRNLRITKDHAADSDKGFFEKSISKPCDRTATMPQRGS